MDNLIDLSSTFRSMRFVDSLIEVALERGEIELPSTPSGHGQMRLAVAQALVDVETAYQQRRPAPRWRRKAKVSPPR
jgi:ABC-type ATPase involved in cell division